MKNLHILVIFVLLVLSSQATNNKFYGSLNKVSQKVQEKLKLIPVIEEQRLTEEEYEKYSTMLKEQEQILKEQMGKEEIDQTIADIEWREKQGKSESEQEKIFYKYLDQHHDNPKRQQINNWWFYGEKKDYHKYSNRLTKGYNFGEGHQEFAPGTFALTSYQWKQFKAHPDQIITTVLGRNNLAHKDKLAKNLHEYDQSPNNRYKNYRSTYGFPTTYILDFSKSHDDEMDLFLKDDTIKGMYLTKTEQGANAAGILLIPDGKEFQTDLKNMELNDFLKKHNHKKAGYVLQKYIENPLLLDKKKFDVRYFVSMISLDPFIVVFQYGYSRKTVVDYDVKSDELAVHVANGGLQKKMPNYKELIEHDVNLSYDDYLLELERQFPEKTKEDIILLDQRTKAAITYGYMAIKDKIVRRKGSVEIMGIDIVIDDNFNPYILEYNYSPSLGITNKAITKEIIRAVEDLTDVALELNHQTRAEIKQLSQEKYDYVCEMMKQQKCEVLINEAVDFTYIDKFDKEDLFKPINMVNDSRDQNNDQDQGRETEL